jgi:hypothetical protein
MEKWRIKAVLTVRKFLFFALLSKIVICRIGLENTRNFCIYSVPEF